MFGILAAVLLAAQPFAEGDRVYAKEKVTLRAKPSENAPAVRELLAGDELAVQAFEDDFHDPPAGWLPVTTTEVPSHRLFSGWLRTADLSAAPPQDFQRAAVLRAEVEKKLDELSARAPPFAGLKEEAMHWKSVPHGEAEGEALAKKLAAYMADDVTPRALDAIDRLDELKSLEDPHAAELGKRLELLSRNFRP